MNMTMDIESLSGRDLDAAICEHVLGWKLCHIGPDAKGENECDILTPDGKLPSYELPRVGKIHRAYCCPEYHRDLNLAIALLKSLGKTTLDISRPIANIPTMVCKQLLREAAFIAGDQGRFT